MTRRYGCQTEKSLWQPILFQFRFLREHHRIAIFIGWRIWIERDWLSGKISDLKRPGNRTSQFVFI